MFRDRTTKAFSLVSNLNDNDEVLGCLVDNDNTTNCKVVTPISGRLISIVETSVVAYVCLMIVLTADALVFRFVFTGDTGNTVHSSHKCYRYACVFDFPIVHKQDSFLRNTQSHIILNTINLYIYRPVTL